MPEMPSALGVEATVCAVWVKRVPSSASASIVERFGAGLCVGALRRRDAPRMSRLRPRL